jgi:uncharacterized protein
MTPILAGLMLGLAGGLHCGAMCGPLMIALRQQTARAGVVALYHAGRIAVYTGLGAVAGLAGHAIAAGGLGRALSIGSGTALIAMAAARAGWRVPGGLTAGMGRLIGQGLQVVRREQHAHPAMATLAAGVLNGLLPCGLVYAALTGSAALAHPLVAAGSMAAFGLATTPVLAVAWWTAGTLPAAVRARLRFAAPLVLVVTGLLLIVRGAETPRLHHAPHVMSGTSMSAHQPRP